MKAVALLVLVMICVLFCNDYIEMGVEKEISVYKAIGCTIVVLLVTALCVGIIVGL